MIDQRPHARVALVGYGLGGSAFHAPFIDANPRLDLVAVVTSNDARAAEVRDRYAGAEVLESVDALFERIEDADLVVVSTPNAFHVPIAERALTSGRPVV